jgi:hypothetical protein
MEILYSHHIKFVFKRHYKLSFQVRIKEPLALYLRPLYGEATNYTYHLF